MLSVWGTERPEDTGRKGRSRSMSWRWAVKGWALITSHGVGCVRVLRRLPKDGLQILLCALICREANLPKEKTQNIGVFVNDLVDGAATGVAGFGVVEDQNGMV